MISELVTFKIPQTLSREDLLENARGTIERWSKFPGLIRKTYVRGEQSICMGIYLWESKDAALKGHDSTWLDKAEVMWGNRPVITYFDTFMELDNEHEEVREFPE